MGALCSCCKRGHGVLHEDNGVQMAKAQSNGGLPPQPRHGRQKKSSRAETEEDRRKAAEAKHQAGLAAQRRADAFDKTPVGRAARKTAAELAKPSPAPAQRGEPALKWQMG